ncbi:MAG TPA: DUF3332 domain-containing protein, partial [Candidatus Cloacimonadota bacterium]|nr:DUF3332 domain-containing protein [Candidatus Cloacimonadota bacterium]
RIVKLTSMALIVVLLAIGLSGCFGNFAATRKVYDFNKSFGDKWVNQIMFWVLSWIPVYGVAGTADVLIFNTVEFWTGSNPLAMAPGEEVIKYASENGKDLKITIRQNQIHVEDLANPGQDLALQYKPFEKSWYYQTEEGLVKIATISQDQASFFRPNGKALTLSATM